MLKIVSLLIPMTLLAGCSIWPNDRCYLAETRYLPMKDTYVQTGSYQRVAQLMKADKWSKCEINQFRYHLRHDLELTTEEFQALTWEEEPPRESLEYYPGRVRNR